MSRMELMRQANSGIYYSHKLEKHRKGETLVERYRVVLEQHV